MNLFLSSGRPAKPPNPDPYNFKIKHATSVNGYTIALVNYPGCTTFGGDKLLLIRGDLPPRQGHPKLDPHFLEGGHPVIARFLPNDEGFKLANVCAHAGSL